MEFEVKLSARVARDLRQIYKAKSAETSPPAASWFLGLRDTIFSLEIIPYRGAVIPENANLRHLLYGNKPHIYRIIYLVDETARVVNIAQVRHGAQRPI